MTRPANLTSVPADKRRPMTKPETTILAASLLLKTKPEPVPARELPEAIMKLGFFTEAWASAMEPQVFLKRLAATDELYDPAAMAFVSVLGDRAGAAVLWAYTVFERTRALGRPYTLDDWVNDFPDGPPTADGALPVWDAQKGDVPDEDSLFGWKSDNLLDSRKLWSRETQDA